MAIGLPDFTQGQHLVAEMQSRSPVPVVLLSFRVWLPVLPLLWSSLARAGVFALTDFFFNITLVDFTEGQSLEWYLRPGLWIHFAGDRTLPFVQSLLWSPVVYTPAELVSVEVTIEC